MLLQIYPFIQSAAYTILLVFVALMLLRLTFNFADPNPFGAVGKFSYKLKKHTDRFVYPAARFLANFRIDPKYAPILTSLIAAVLVYFALRVIYDAFFTISGLILGISQGNPLIIVGFLLYGLLSLLILFIFLRFISSWFVFTRDTFFGFVRKVTDPIMLPVQRMIPPVGMFDISAMILLILIGFLQTIILRTFVG